MTSVPSGSVNSIWMTSFAPHVAHCNGSTGTPLRLFMFGRVVETRALRCGFRDHPTQGEPNRRNNRFGSNPAGQLGKLVQLPDVSGPALALLPPVGIPVGTMRATRTTLFATFDHLSPQLHLGLCRGPKNPPLLESSACEDEESTELGLFHLPNCFENIPVDGHRQPYAGTVNRRAIGERRSTKVHPTGGLSRAA